MAKRLISYFGDSMSVSLRRTTKDVDPVTGQPVDVVETDSTYGCFIDASDTMLASETISLEDLMLLLPPELSLVPDEKTIVIVGGVSYKVKSYARKAPGGTVIYHKLIVREVGD
jgi:hypothetical protein